MPVVPTAPTIAPGILTSSKLNQLRDVERFAQAKPVALLRQTSAQNLANATYAAIQFQAEDVDDDIDGIGGHDNVTNNSRWTARYPGWYLVSGMTTFAANATGSRICGLRVVGADLNGSFRSALPIAATNVLGVSPATMSVYLGVGDFVEMVAWQDSGGTLATYVALTAFQSSMTIGWERS